MCKRSYQIIPFYIWGVITNPINKKFCRFKKLNMEKSHEKMEKSHEKNGKKIEVFLVK